MGNCQEYCRAALGILHGMFSRLRNVRSDRSLLETAER